MPPSSSSGGRLRFGGTLRDVDEARVARGDPDLGVAARELLGDLERGLAEHVEHPQLQGGLDGAAEALDRGAVLVVREGFEDPRGRPPGAG